VVYASQSGETRVGGGTGAVGLRSFRAYTYGEKGLVRVNFQEWAVKIKRRRREVGESSAASHPPSADVRLSRMMVSLLVCAQLLSQAHRKWRSD
jgi:hypothetical protein